MSGSWHICYLLCQEPDEEIIFSFLWRRLQMDIETSKF